MSGSHPADLIKKQSYQKLITQYKKKFEVESQGFELPQIKYEFTIARKKIATNPEFFVAIPIKNQQNLIREVLQNLVPGLGFPFDIGLLFDNCDDASFQEAVDVISELMENSNMLNQVHFITSTDELFESTCENVLFTLCDAKYFVSFQADTMLEDFSFFDRSRSAFASIPNLLGVSGRATVPFMPSRLLKAKVNSLLFTTNILTILLPRVFKERRLGPFFKGSDYFGDTSGFPFPRMKFSQRELTTLFIGQALIRGPIVWSAEKFRNLGGFNDVAFFLGRDDCDLSLRGLNKGFVVGYLPCQQVSNPNNGTTRKPRTVEVQARLGERTELHSAHPGALDSYWNKDYRERKRILGHSSFERIRID